MNLNKIDQAIREITKDSDKPRKLTDSTKKQRFGGSDSLGSEFEEKPRALKYEPEERFGKLVVLQKGYIYSEVTDRKRDSGTRICRCDCGKKIKVSTKRLWQGKSSCGCDREKKARSPLPLHGTVLLGVKVVDWEEGKGWNCECLNCGAKLVSRHSIGLVKTASEHWRKTHKG